MIRPVHVVTTQGDGEEAAGSTVRSVTLGVPGAVVDVTAVAPLDTLAAGMWVARLALAGGPPERLIVHYVAAADEDHDLCVGRTDSGVLVIGPNSGWSWSFAFDELHGPCHVDVPELGSRLHTRDVLHAALAHLVAAHPHAIRAVVGRDQVPAVPESAVAYTDRDGNLETTIDRPPAEVGDRLTVRVGDVAAGATVARSRSAVAEGELGLAAGPISWPTRAGAEHRLLELFVRGGSAAERFGHPPSGAPVVISA
jgi:S-adenosyl-l-methionine hydroxide adenosyltransferase